MMSDAESFTDKFRSPPRPQPPVPLHFSQSGPKHTLVQIQDNYSLWVPVTD
jgi:hypothetical protein